MRLGPRGRGRGVAGGVAGAGAHGFQKAQVDAHSRSSHSGHYFWGKIGAVPLEGTWLWRSWPAYLGDIRVAQACHQTSLSLSSPVCAWDDRPAGGRAAGTLERTERSGRAAGP